MTVESNLHNPPAKVFVAVAPADFAVNLGAAGWVDTDVSATCGADVSKAWLVVASVTGPQLTGAREHGSAIAATVTTTHEVTLLSHVDATGHMDLYRNAAANASYRIMGFLQ